MRCLKLIFAISLAASGLMLVAAPYSNVAVADDIPDAEKPYAVSHRLNDLPVWTQDGKTFNPALLITYLEAAVDTAENRATIRIAPYPPENPSVLVVVTTSANHDHVGRALERLRDSRVQADVK